MKRLLPTHPPGYTSIQYPLADQLKKFAQEMRVGGLFYAINRLRVQNHLRLGRLVGEDSNGNKYYENTNNAYGRTRWFEPKVPMRAFEMDAHYDASQVTPEWHGWLHYVSDKPGGVMKNEFSQPWVTVHTQNPSIDRSTHYVPPGHWKNTLPRGRIGPKYESWTPAGSDEPVPALRNYSDNTHTLRVSE